MNSYNTKQQSAPDVFGVTLLKANPKDRTITIARTFDGIPFVAYKSTELSWVEYDYYESDATPGDLLDFLKKGSYKVINLSDV